jgi:chromosome segregation ATPase
VSKADELDKLDKAIKNAEISLKSIKTTIEQLGKEIAILAPRKNELEQNLEFHKKAEIVPIAHEYKKAKSELSKTKNRLAMITSDQKKAMEACKDIEEIIAKFRSDYIKLIKTSENNILTPNFGGSRGKR